MALVDTSCRPLRTKHYRRGNSGVDLEAALQGAQHHGHDVTIFTPGNRLKTSFLQEQPPGPNSLKQKFLWPEEKLGTLKGVSVAGAYGLGHMWHNLKQLWQRGVDLRTKYSGIGIIEAGLDLVEQEWADWLSALLPP